MHTLCANEAMNTVSGLNKASLSPPTLVSNKLYLEIDPSEFVVHQKKSERTIIACEVSHKATWIEYYEFKMTVW